MTPLFKSLHWPSLPPPHWARIACFNLQNHLWSCSSSFLYPHFPSRLCPWSLVLCHLRISYSLRRLYPFSFAVPYGWKCLPLYVLSAALSPPCSLTLRHTFSKRPLVIQTWPEGDWMFFLFTHVCSPFPSNCWFSLLNLKVFPHLVKILSVCLSFDSTLYTCTWCRHSIGTYLMQVSFKS